MDPLRTVSREIAVGGFRELDLGTDVTQSPRFNADIAPTRVAQRTWTHWHIAALWVGMSICVPTYTLGGVLTAYFGLSVSEALWTILIANVVILIPLTLNAFPGTKYGIPFPVVLRSSFGIVGSNVPALIRALVACGWFGIQTMFGGIAVHLLLSALFEPWAALGGRGEVAGFFIFWVANLWVVIRGAESIKHLVHPDHLEVKLFIAEPQLTGKPICMNWDERGRLVPIVPARHRWGIAVGITARRIARGGPRRSIPHPLPARRRRYARP